MAKLRVITRWMIRVRAQQRTREILLAIALTVAAAAFIAAAMSGIDQPVQSRHVQSGAPPDESDK